ncbi:hypothetical protein [Streptomyces sp. NPDC054784]
MSATAICRPISVFAGEIYCLDLECDHDLTDGAHYCDEVREENVCGTHSRFVQAENGFEEVVHSEPWPCPHAASAPGGAS